MFSLTSLKDFFLTQMHNN